MWVVRWEVWGSVIVSRDGHAGIHVLLLIISKLHLLAPPVRNSNSPHVHQGMRVVRVVERPELGPLTIAYVTDTEGGYYIHNNRWDISCTQDFPDRLNSVSF